ncbi:MAG TPA: class I SAM-dependent methyltransferase [bacterium]|nr:class I SAM-dependent methyltransferase [bacterium]
MDLTDQIRLHALQAEWTWPMRRELYRRARLASCKSVLDVGCGDGKITEEMAGICRGRVAGVDANAEAIEAARARQGRAEYSEADACSLPFGRSSFDLVTCHWLLLWLPDPVRALREFSRILKPEGTVLLACEPDYGGRMVEPPEAGLRDELMEALAGQGADPLIGRKLAGLLAAAGFAVRELGLYPGVWDSRISEDRLKEEEHWLRTVLSGRVAGRKLDSALRSLHQAHRQGSLMMVTPVFWAMAGKKG